MTNFVKFSDFAQANLGNPANKRVGYGGGLNYQTPDTTTWTTATRPLSPYNGLMGFNTTTGFWEYWSNLVTAWLQFDTSSPTGVISPALQYSIAYYSSMGTESVLSGINSPLLNGAIFQSNNGAPASWSLATYPSATVINQLLYSSANDVVSGLTTINNGVLTTSNTGVPVMATSLPAGVNTHGYVLLGVATASNSASIQFTGLNGAIYSEFRVVFDNIIPVTNNTVLAMKLSQGGVFQPSGYYYQTLTFSSTPGSATSGGATNSGAFGLTYNAGLGTGVNQQCGGYVCIGNPALTGVNKNANWQISGRAYNSVFYTLTGGGALVSTTGVIDGILFVMTAGNISSGTFYLYGLLNS